MKNTKDFLIRKIPNEQLEKLKILAKNNQFHSVNEYLLFQIEQVTTADYVLKTELRYAELVHQHENLAKAFLKQTDELKQLIEKIGERL